MKTKTTTSEPIPRVVEGRGKGKAEQFVQSMEHELERNAFKGDWLDFDRAQHGWELLYHAMKLIVLINETDSSAVGIQELCADVGNHAMFIADAEGALGAELTDEPTVLYAEDGYDIEAMKTELKSWYEKYFNDGKVVVDGHDHPRQGGQAAGGGSGAKDPTS